MDKLVETIFSVLEMLVLGSISLMFLTYVGVFCHPCKRILTDYIRAIAKYVFDDLEPPFAANLARAPAKRRNRKSERAMTAPYEKVDSSHEETARADVRRWIKIGVTLGIVYYLGVLANASAYFVFQRAHLAIIASVQPNGQGLPAIDHSKTSFGRIFVPRVWEPFDADSELKHADAIYREMQWRHLSKEVAGVAIEHLEKHIQLLRGTALIAGCFAIMALLKVVVALSTWVLLPARPVAPKRARASLRERSARCLYTAFIDGSIESPSNRAGRPETATRREMRRHTTTNRVLRPNALIFLIAFVTYSVALSAWTMSEIEYHSIVVAGHAATKAIAKKP